LVDGADIGLAIGVEVSEAEVFDGLLGGSQWFVVRGAT